MMSPAIIVLAYNRPNSLQRLLLALEDAVYPVIPHLVLSIEGGAAPDVIKIANEFKSDKFIVKVICRSKRLGLRDHVIACVDLTKVYDSVLILEDDLLVDRYFYSFASAALDFYRNDKIVAGVSLYSYEHNEFSGLPFKPLYNGHSTYFMQVPCSWGQGWTRNQWESFKEWYLKNSQNKLSDIHGLPEAVKNWPESSWKKYFHGYILSSGKYFVYPYESFATNCADDVGTHNKGASNTVQVSMPSKERPVPNFLMCPSSNWEVVYDAYMEPIGDFIYRALGLPRSQVTIDIQGQKPLALLKKKKYALTIKSCLNSVSRYPLNYRPPENNLLHSSSAGLLSLVSVDYLSENDGEDLPLSFFNYYAGMELCRGRIIKSVFGSLFDIKTFKYLLRKINPCNFLLRKK